MKSCITAVLLGGLLSLSRADLVKTKDGQSYPGTVQYSDVDSIKLQPADSSEVKVFRTDEVEEVQVDSVVSQETPPEDSEPSSRFSPEYWDQQGYAAGKSLAPMKSALAGTGGCVGVPAGGYAGALVSSASSPYASSPVACCLLGAAAGGAVGCLGGGALGTLGQRDVVSPILDSVSREAYVRGYQRGVRHSNNVALGVGTGVTVLATAGFVGLTFAFVAASARITRE